MKKPAFTLVEMIVSLTVFTLFVGLAMGGYLSFHRAQKDAETTRRLLFDAQHVVDLVTNDVKENAIAYHEYGVGFLDADLLKAVELRTRLSTGTDAIEATRLVLEAGEDQIVYEWEDEVLTRQLFEAGEEAPGYEEAQSLFAEGVTVELAKFRIVPGKDPYDSENILSGDSTLWYQPNVQFELWVSAPGRVRDKIVIDLTTSITSRLYD